MICSQTTRHTRHTNQIFFPFFFVWFLSSSFLSRTYWFFPMCMSVYVYLGELGRIHSLIVSLIFNRSVSIVITWKTNEDSQYHGRRHHRSRRHSFRHQIAVGGVIWNRPKEDKPEQRKEKETISTRNKRKKDPGIKREKIGHPHTYKHTQTYKNKNYGTLPRSHSMFQWTKSENIGRFSLTQREREWE